MVKRYHGGIDATRSDGKYDYWPIPIGSSNPYCDLVLKGIHISPYGDPADVRSSIASTGFASITPTGP